MDVISGYNDIKGKNFDVVQDIGAMSGYNDIKVFASISKVLSISGTICLPSAAAVARPWHELLAGHGGQ